MAQKAGRRHGGWPEKKGQAEVRVLIQMQGLDAGREGLQWAWPEG